jgi:hypothetical protein
LFLISERGPVGFEPLSDLNRAASLHFGVIPSYS